MIFGIALRLVIHTEGTSFGFLEIPSFSMVGQPSCVLDFEENIYLHQLFYFDLYCQDSIKGGPLLLLLNIFDIRWDFELMG